MGKRVFKKLLVILGVIAIIFLLLNADFREVIKNIKSIPPKFLISGAVLQIITMILLAVQWKSITGWTDRKVSFIDIFLVNIKGNIVDSITPGVKVGGELARIYQLKQALGLDTANATIIVGLQKTISLLSFLFLTLISLVWFNLTLGNDYRHYSYLFSVAVIIFMLLLAVLIVVCLKPNIIGYIINRLPIKPGLRRRLNTGLRDYYNILLNLASNKRQFLYQFLLGIVIWGIFALKMFLIVTAFNIRLNLLSIGAITYLTYAIGMIPLLPGSIGSFEASMVALLGIQGVAIDIGISISIVFRFITFWFEFLVSLIIYIIEKLFSLYRKGGKYAKKEV